MGYQWFDNIINVLSGLGVPGRDKSTGATFVFLPLAPQELEAAYRSDWVAGKIIDAPADDATREWRSWQCGPDDIEAIENEEKKFSVQNKIRDGIVLSRLFGGSAVIIGVDQGTSDKELMLDKVKQGDLKFVHTVSRYSIQTGPIITDLMDPYYGMPEYFTRNTGQGDLQIHPSRVIILRGKTLPDQSAWTSNSQQCWGDSTLQRAIDAVRDASSVFQTSATLLNEAKIDIFKIPDLSLHIASQAYQKKLTDRFTFANSIKSIINTVLMDKDEEWQRVTTDFGPIPELMRMFMLVAAGAADIPVTRLVGQSPAGLSSTGESDMRNYYDRISSDQERELTPTLNRLDEVIIRSALGSRDPSIYYEWNPLWQMSETEQATVGKLKSEAFKIDVDAGVVDVEALRIGRQNQLIEDGVYPGLEQALEAQKLLEESSMLTPEEQAAADLQAQQQALAAAGAQPGQPGQPGQPSNVVSIKKKAVGDSLDWLDFNENHDPNTGEFSEGTGGSANLQAAPKSRDSWPAHIQALKLPPAWTGVRINDDPDAPLQAIGKDSKGRDQYVYSAKYRETQSGLKFARIKELAGKYDKVQQQNADHAASSDAILAEHARAAGLVMSTGIRPGSDSDTKAAKKAYGATTLEGRHVVVKGDSVRLQFVGKKGVSIDIPVSDTKIAVWLKDRAAHAGPKGRIFTNVTQGSLLDYTHSLDGGGFKTKDFRTLLGTQTALKEVSKRPAPKSMSAYKVAVKDVAKIVSGVLGNTPAIALQSYIAPQVFAPWQAHVSHAG